MVKKSPPSWVILAIFPLTFPVVVSTKSEISTPVTVSVKVALKATADKAVICEVGLFLEIPEIEGLTLSY